VRYQVTKVKVPIQTGVYFDSLVLLEDGSGYWQFDSDDVIMWDFGVTGKPLTVPKFKGKGKVHG